MVLSLGLNHSLSLSLVSLFSPGDSEEVGGVDGTGDNGYAEELDDAEGDGGDLIIL